MSLQDVHEVGANVVQLGLGAIAGANAVERPPNENERLVEGVVKRAAHMAHRVSGIIARSSHRIEATNATAMTARTSLAAAEGAHRCRSPCKSDPCV